MFLTAVTKYLDRNQVMGAKGCFGPVLRGDTVTMVRQAQP